jgi:hypothetical protein
MSNTMYHVTPRYNVASILEHGLQVDCAIGRIKGVWLCDALRLPWAIAHVAKHHGVDVVNLSAMAVDVSKYKLRGVRIGVKVCEYNLSPLRIGDVVYYALGEPE